ncbi:MAG: helix-turn-helix transcriptional regulator [Planctomycetota bacterium]|jgi:AraC-like DNA-binding protein
MAGQFQLRGAFDCPSVRVRDVRCRPHSGQRSSEEWSADHQIIFPRCGHFVWHVRGRDVAADANHVLFYTRDEAYRVSHPAPGGDECTVFEFDSDVLIDALARYEPEVRDRPHRPFSFTEAPTEPALFLLHHWLTLQLRGGTDNAMAVEEHAMHLLEAVIDGAYASRGRLPVGMRPETARVHRQIADAAKIVLAQRFRERLALSDVAGAVHCSPYHLARLFRRNVGSAIHHYRNRLRLRASLEPLADGADNLTDLALHLGYSSHAHFSDAFSREFAITPSQFRRSATVSRLREMSTILKV